MVNKKEYNLHVAIIILVAAAIIIGIINLIISVGLSSNCITGNAVANNEDNAAPSLKPDQVVKVSADDDAVKGNKNAKVEIIEFTDYQCPFCGRYVQQTYPSILKDYVDKGKIKYVVRDFPLSFHQYSEKAAEAAECAGEQGKYWEMHDILFKNQQALDIDSLKKYAADIGLDTDKFNTCLDSGAMKAEVQKDFNDGRAAGVSGTPTFFINGHKLVGAQPYEAFKQMIDAELAK